MLAQDYRCPVAEQHARGAARPLGVGDADQGAACRCEARDAGGGQCPQADRQLRR